MRNAQVVLVEDGPWTCGSRDRLLNEQGVAIRKGISRRERSTIWAMLRNPAYKGTACFNKTKSSKRQRITRPIRLRGENGVT